MFLIFLFIQFTQKINCQYRSDLPMLKRIQNFQLISIQSTSQDRIQYIKAKQINTQNFFTLKKIKINNQTSKSLNIESEMKSYQVLYNKLLQQANVLNILNHQSVPKFHKILRTKQNLYLVYDYHPSNNLIAYFQKARPTFSEKIKLSKKMCEILMYIHSKGIVLKELRPERILINKKGEIFFTGFQQSQIIKQKQKYQQIKLDKKSSYTKSKNNINQNQISFSYKRNIFNLGNIFKEIFKFTSVSSLIKKQSQSREIAKIVQLMVSKNQEEIPQIQQIIQVLNKTNSQYNSTTASQDPCSPTLSKQSPSSPTYSKWSPSSPTFTGLSSSSRFNQKRLIQSGSRQHKKSASPIKNNSKILTKSSLQCSISQKIIFYPRQYNKEIKKQRKQFGKMLKLRNSIIFLLQMSKFSLQFSQQELGKLLIKTSTNINQELINLINQIKPKIQEEKSILTGFMNQAKILQKINSQNAIVKVNKLKRLKSLNNDNDQLKIPDYIQKHNKIQQNKLLNTLIINFGQYLIELLQRQKELIQQKRQNQILKKYYYLSCKIKYGTFEDFFTLKMIQGQKQLWKNPYFEQFQKNGYSNQKLSGQIVRRLQKWKLSQTKN